MCSVFEYYSNNILFVFVFGHNSESEYYSYSYSAKYLCTNIIRIRIRSFWENEYYSYSYSVKILIPNNIRIRIRSKKQYSLTSEITLLAIDIDNIGCLEPFLPLWEHFWNRVSVELNCASDLTPRLKWCSKKPGGHNFDFRSR